MPPEKPKAEEKEKEEAQMRECMGHILEEVQDMAIHEATSRETKRERQNIAPTEAKPPPEELKKPKTGPTKQAIAKPLKPGGK